MSYRRRCLGFETLDPRRVLSAVAIAADLSAEPSEQVVVPVAISDAENVRAAEITIQYDTALLDADSGSVTAGSVWTPGTAEVVASVDDEAGTLVVWVFAAEGLDSDSGSLVEIAFTVASDGAAGSSAAINLVEVVLNEGEIAVDPEPQAGQDSTDGQVAVVAPGADPGITVSPTTGMVTSEAGTVATFTVVLDSEPTADVVIRLASDDTTEGTPSAAELRFTPDNWEEPQTVNVTGVDDAIDDGDVLYTIVTAAAVSDDENYDGLDAANVSVTNEDDETFTAVDLGQVDFTCLRSLDPSAAELWFTLEAVRDAWLTVQAVDAWTTGELTFYLYQPTNLDVPIASSKLEDGKPRLDHQAQEGQTYLVQVTGTASNVSLVLVNLVHEDGTAITVYGTDGADEFVFSAAASRKITINDVVYQYEDSQVSTVDFDGGEGRDLVWLYDSAGDERLEAWPDRATLTSDSDDSVVDFVVQVSAVEDLLAYATVGGSDSAVLHGSEAVDKLKSYEDSVRLRAQDSSYTLRVKKFDTVVGDGGSGGSDLAVFSGSDGVDTFTYDGSGNSGRVQAEGRDHTASGFASLVARGASGGGDVANLTDVPGIDNVFYFRSHKTVLSSDNVKVTVRLYDEVHATAGGEGYNVARIYDTSGDDLLEVAGDTARLYTGTQLDLLYEAIGFDRVKAYSSAGGADTTDIGEHTIDLYLDGWDT